MVPLIVFRSISLPDQYREVRRKRATNTIKVSTEYVFLKTYVFIWWSDYYPIHWPKRAAK